MPRMPLANPYRTQYTYQEIFEFEAGLCDLELDYRNQYVEEALKSHFLENK